MYDIRDDGNLSDEEDEYAFHFFLDAQSDTIQLLVVTTI